jgi:hypothetical protein
MDTGCGGSPSRRVPIFGNRFPCQLGLCHHVGDVAHPARNWLKFHLWAWVRHLLSHTRQGFTMTEPFSLGLLGHRSLWICAAVGLFACGGVSVPTDLDSTGGMLGTGGQSNVAGATSITSGGSSDSTTTAPETGGTSTTGGASSTGGTSAVPPCGSPAYSSDCSQVPYFQCGTSVHCDGTTALIQWHEHVMCAQANHTGMYDSIHSYSCTYPCATAACESLGGWPSSGSAVALACDAK